MAEFYRAYVISIDLGKLYASNLIVWFKEISFINAATLAKDLKHKVTCTMRI
jgi:hypothetical protein